MVENWQKRFNNYLLRNHVHFKIHRKDFITSVYKLGILLLMTTASEVWLLFAIDLYGDN